MRRVLILLALLLAALLGWFTLRRGRSSAESLAPPPVADVAKRTDAPHALDPSPESKPAAARQAEPSASPKPESVKVDPAAESIELKGTIVAIDENGVEHANEDGAFGLVSWKAQGGKVDTVAVHGGAWTARVAPGVELGCQDALLGGRSAVPDGELVDHELRHALPADGVVALRVRWLRALRIFVRDRDTKLDLAAVTIVRAEDWPRAEVANPGDLTPRRILVQSKPSPVVARADGRARA